MADEYVSVGQGLIPMELYLANKAYYDGHNLTNTVGSPTPSGVGESISATMDNFKDTVSKLLDPKQITIKYEYGAGHDSITSSPMSKKSAKVDETAFIGWSLYELGLISSAEAVEPLETILTTDNFLFISDMSTSSDTTNYKLSLLNEKILYGDILMFDTNKPNGTAGIYTNNDQVLMLVPSSNTTDVTEINLYETFEDGTKVATDWLDRFNGGIYRPKILNGEGYTWYNTINN